MAIDTPYNHTFLTQDGHLTGELSFRDGQMGFVGIAGITWTILPDGSCQASRFVNDNLAPPYQTGHLEQPDLAMLANTLSTQNFADLPAEIPSEPTLNPHQLTIFFSGKSSTLVLKPGQSIENALITEKNQQETPRSRFLTVAQVVNQLVWQYCGND